MTLYDVCTLYLFLAFIYFDKRKVFIELYVVVFKFLYNTDI